GHAPHVLRVAGVLFGLLRHVPAPVPRQAIGTRAGPAGSAARRMNASLPYGLLLLLLGLILAVLLVIAFVKGAHHLSCTRLLPALAAGVGSDPEAGLILAVRVVWDLRLPRIAAALLVGAALSTAGAAYQTMFRNPLVSPDILGVSSGAGLGAILAIYL